MRKIISKTDKRHFYKLSWFILIGYLALLVLSIITATLNYITSKYINNSDTFRNIVALTLSTIHSAIIIAVWVASKIQKGRIDYIKSKKFSLIMGLVMDCLSAVSIAFNTVTSLVNGHVLHTDATSLIPFMSLVTAIISLFNFIMAIYFVVVGKKAINFDKKC